MTITVPTFLETRPEEAARGCAHALRDELLARNWPTSAEVGRRLGIQPADAAKHAAKKRKERRLFGVWSLKDNTYLHPDFQFDVHHRMHPALPALLRALAVIPGMSDEEDQGGWRRVFWLYGAGPQLSDRALGTGDNEMSQSAADLFHIHPEAVIAVADREALRELNAEW